MSTLRDTLRDLLRTKVGLHFLSLTYIFSTPSHTTYTHIYNSHTHSCSLSSSTAYSPLLLKCLTYSSSSFLLLPFLFLPSLFSLLPSSFLLLPSSFFRLFKGLIRVVNHLKRIISSPPIPPDLASPAARPSPVARA